MQDWENASSKHVERSTTGPSFAIDKITLTFSRTRNVFNYARHQLGMYTCAENHTWISERSFVLQENKIWKN